MHASMDEVFLKLARKAKDLVTDQTELNTFIMKQFIIFRKKRILSHLRDRRTLFILLGMPIVQIIIFGFALTNEVKNSQIAIFDQCKRSEYPAQSCSELDASRYFDIAQNLHSYQEIEAAFKKGKIKLAVVFPQHFDNDLEHFNKAQVQLIADASDPNMANTLTNYATAIIIDYQDRITNNRKLPYTINTEMRMLYNPQLKGAYSFVPGVMAMVLMLVCTMMTAITIVREKELGTMEVMLVSPMQPLKIIVAKAVPYLLIIDGKYRQYFVAECICAGCAHQWQPAVTDFESILFTLTCLAFGLLISSATDSQQTAMFISLTGMFLPTIMLSGFMFPIENMPLPLQMISNVVPAKWFYYYRKRGNDKRLGIAAVWKETLILAGMMLFLYWH